MTKEIWKDIKGYEGLYQVSNLGRVKSLERVVTRSNGRTLRVSERILLPYIRGRKYLSVRLSADGTSKTFYVHRIVAKAFLYKKPNSTEVNHKNGDKQDNSSTNLEWVTPEENIEHALREGLHPKPRKPVHMLNLKGEHLITFPSTTEAAKYIGKSARSDISAVCKGERKTAYGYKWRYVDEVESA